jgi:hypothetical protein
VLPEGTFGIGRFWLTDRPVRSEAAGLGFTR